MAQIKIDPDEVTRIYKERLNAVTEEVILLTAAVNGLQAQFAEAERTKNLLQEELDRGSTKHHSE